MLGVRMSVELIKIYYNIDIKYLKWLGDKNLEKCWNDQWLNLNILKSPSKKSVILMFQMMKTHSDYKFQISCKLILYKISYTLANGASWYICSSILHELERV